MKSKTHGISPKDNDNQPKTQKELLRIKTSLRVVEGFCEIGAGGKCRLVASSKQEMPLNHQKLQAKNNWVYRFFGAHGRLCARIFCYTKLF